MLHAVRGRTTLGVMSQASTGPRRAGDAPQAGAVTRGDVFARDCPSRAVMQEITGRWGALALAALEGRTMRFGELRRRVDGVSERMLAQTLRTLERDGLVHREVVQHIPPRVEYSLTALGAQVAAHLLPLIVLLEESMPQVRLSQQRYDQAAGPVRE